jgi:ADA HAT complex component 1
MVETPRNAHIRSLSEGNRHTPASSSFLASPITPHLSSLMQHQGIGVDLSQLVDEAKATIDLEAYSSGDENDEGSEDEIPSPPPSSTDLNAGMSEARGGRQPIRTVVVSQQPSTSRDARKPQPLETLTPLRPGAPYIPSYGSTPSSTIEDNVDGMDLTVNLSPHAVESNQAPSLVSDDDDDGDTRSDSTGSPGPSSSEAEDSDGQDFSHIDVEDDDETTSSATAAATEPKSGPPSLANSAPTAAPLAKSLRRGSHPRSQNKKKKNDRFISSSTALDSGNNKEEKRVSFVSPQLSPDSSPSKGKDGHGRKWIPFPFSFPWRARTFTYVL